MIKPNDTVFLILVLVATCAAVAFHLLKRCLLRPGAGFMPSTSSSLSSSSEGFTAPRSAHFPVNVVDVDHPDDLEHAEDIRFVPSEADGDSVEPDEVEANTGGGRDVGCA